MDNTGLILMYHRIANPPIDPWGLCVTPEHFSEQLEVIKDLGAPMALEDFVDAQQFARLPTGAIALSFDDGYVDNFTSALPLLQQHDIPATVFVTSCNIDSEREFWWDELESILLRPSVLPGSLELELMGEVRRWELGPAIDYSDEQFQSDRKVRAWTADAQTRMKLYHEVWSALWPLEPRVRDLAMTKLRQWTGIAGDHDAARRTLTSEEIRRLAASDVISIGSHTSDHSPLPRHSLEVQREEIEVCQRKLRDITGCPVRSFAYPHGEHSDETASLLRKIGIEIALTVQMGQVYSDTDPLRLPRYGVNDMSGQDFRRQLLAWRGQ